MIIQPNRWSCLPTAFAMAMGCSLEQLLWEIGHDGSEIVFPDLPEPRCRRTFHIQECLIAAIKMGKHFVHLEWDPTLSPDGRVSLAIQQDHDFIIKWAKNKRGVALGIGKAGLRHAVCFDSEIIYDPNGTSYPWLDFWVSDFWVLI